MEAFNIDLTVFLPRYRQALLFAMIEGLVEGAAFTFQDNRTPQEIEAELHSAHLTDCHWERKGGKTPQEVTYYIEKSPSPQMKTGCCGFCGDHGDKA